MAKEILKTASLCIFYSVFAHFIHININRSTREHIKNNICAILNSYNKVVSGQFFGNILWTKCTKKAVALLVLKECMSVHLVDFHKKVF